MVAVEVVDLGDVESTLVVARHRRLGGSPLAIHLLIRLQRREHDKRKHRQYGQGDHQRLEIAAEQLEGAGGHEGILPNASRFEGKTRRQAAGWARHGWQAATGRRTRGRRRGLGTVVSGWHTLGRRAGRDLVGGLTGVALLTSDRSGPTVSRTGYGKQAARVPCKTLARQCTP